MLTPTSPCWHTGTMDQLLVGYARVSTEQQDLTAQRRQLAALGVGDDRIYVDHGLTGINRDGPDSLIWPRCDGSTWPHLRRAAGLVTV